MIKFNSVIQTIIFIAFKLPVMYNKAVKFNLLGGNTVIKRIAAAVLTVAMTAALFTGCSKNFEKVVTVDGMEFTPSMYLCAQYNAYNTAYSETEAETHEEVMAAEIEGMSAEEWIHQETIKNLQVYAWTEKTFEEMGLELLAEETDYINQLVEYYWPYSEELYKANGIGKETYTKFNTFSFKYDKIFSTLYSEGGEREVTDAEYKDYMDSKYARISGFYMPKQNKVGGKLTDDELTAIKDYCAQAVKELNDGAKVEDVSVKYKTMASEYLKLEIDYSDPANNLFDSFISKDTTAFSAEVADKAFAMSNDSEYVFAEMDEDFAVFKRVANFETDEEFANIKMDLLAEMKSEEFNAYAEELAAKLATEEDAAAVKFYAVSKIK